jgi:UDP-N-acetylmuramate--alanine ligase
MHYHIVGIAGAGMSGIARLLLDQGHTVSGSDPVASSFSAALAERGARILPGHDPAYVAGAQALVATSAVSDAHPELVAARDAGIAVLRRADLWREWSQTRRVIAVAGTHGKTTTSAMVALALQRAGLNPGWLIGSTVPDLGGNAAWGDPQAPLVIEADEYDRTFLALTPDAAIVTSVEWDHPDIYSDPERYREAFAAFISSVAAPERLVYCGDDAYLPGLAPRSAISYGIDEELARNPSSCRIAPLDWSASGMRYDAEGNLGFDVWRYNRRTFGARRLWRQSLRLAGAHNLRNALAALAVAALYTPDLRGPVEALAAFSGTGRRCELKGEVGGVTVIDDYGHHPTEVQTTLGAMRDRYTGRRIVAYLQPHTFSRTAALHDDWVALATEADLWLIGDVFPAREQGDVAAAARELATALQAQAPSARYAGPVAAAPVALAEVIESGDVVVIFGAGDSDRIGPALLAQLAQVAAG